MGSCCGGGGFQGGGWGGVGGGGGGGGVWVPRLRFCVVGGGGGGMGGGGGGIGWLGGVCLVRLSPPVITKEEAPISYSKYLKKNRVKKRIGRGWRASSEP